MKFTLSLIVLAAAASQAMAVVPTPIASCTKTVVVQATDIDGCAAFAARNSITFDDLLKWNLKLRADCLNLDLGEKMCISITPGAAATAVTSSPATTTTPTATATATTSNKPPSVTGASAPDTTKSDAPTAKMGKSSLTLGVVSALLACVYVL
ncbi:hypothetical protein BGZ73_005862 [Actinomortierella ambigua]|nr:hypothetical protein BGZ73_005862 [Actinomortierella ambigua]